MTLSPFRRRPYLKTATSSVVPVGLPFCNTPRHLFPVPTFGTGKQYPSTALAFQETPPYISFTRRPSPVRPKLLLEEVLGLGLPTVHKPSCYGHIAKQKVDKKRLRPTRPLTRVVAYTRPRPDATVTTRHIQARRPVIVLVRLLTSLGVRRPTPYAGLNVVLRPLHMRPRLVASPGVFLVTFSFCRPAIPP